MEIKPRLHHWWVVFGVPFRALTGVSFCFGLVTEWRDNFLPSADRAKWDTYKFLPHWSPWAWFALALVFVIAGVLEGSFRLDRKRLATIGQLAEVPSAAYRRVCAFRDELIELNREARQKLEWHGERQRFWLRVDSQLLPLLLPHDQTKVRSAYAADLLGGGVMLKLDQELDRLAQTTQPNALPVPPWLENIDGLSSQEG